MPIEFITPTDTADVQQLRLACLKMAADNTDPTSRINEAENYLRFVTGHAEKDRLSALFGRFYEILDSVRHYDRDLAIFTLEREVKAAFVEAGLELTPIHFSLAR